MYPSIHLSFRLRWHSEDHGRLPDEDMSKHSHKNLDHGRLPAVHVSKHVRRNHLVWTPFEAIAIPFLPPKKTFFSLGSLGRTHDDGHVGYVFLQDSTWSSATTYQGCT